jgi:hypothetical protein
MSDAAQYDKLIADLSNRLQAKLKLRPAPFARLVARSKGRLPRHVYQNARTLVDAERFTHHPKLARTVDFKGLSQSADVVKTHLNSIDLAEERKDRILSILASIAFSLIVAFALLVLVLSWRGFL